MFRQRVRRLGARSNNAADRMVKGITEGIAGLKEVRILGKELFFYEQVRTNAKHYGLNHAQSITLATVPRYLFETVLITFIIVLVLTSIARGEELQDLLPVLGVFGLAAVRLLPAASIISRGVVQFRFNRDAVRRLWFDLSRESGTFLSDDPGCSDQPKTKFEQLDVEDICYSYPESKNYALENLSLTIRSGEAVGIIGPSGSGKTTLIDVLLGLMTPSGGVIKFNGNDYETNLSAWRSPLHIYRKRFLPDASQGI